MYKIARPLILHCQTPLHAGTGSDLGYIDLPIQREKHTGFPKIEASSLKGALREVFEGEQEIEYPSRIDKTIINKGVKLAFGPDTNGAEHAAALGFTDARLLLFPVKSLKGIFAWVTCPKVLEKFDNELKTVCGLDGLNSAISTINEIDNDNILIASNSDCIINTSKVVLEDYVFTVGTDDVKAFGSELETLLGITNLTNQLAIVSNDTFADLVKLHTEVIARIKINNETGVTDNLFNEEFLPAESVLYSMVLASPIFQKKGDKGIFEGNTEKKDYEKLLNYFNAGIDGRNFQLGGDATLGKGIIKPTLITE